MKAIDPPNMEPPSGSLYDDLEVWKVTITWDDNEYGMRYIPYIGYDSHEMLDGFKRDFYKEVMEYLGHTSHSQEEVFVYSILLKEDAGKECLDEGYLDTFALLFSLPCYSAEEPYKTRYYKKDITDWLKDNSERWLKIESTTFWKIPEEEQKKIRSFIEEERAISKAINEGKL